MKTALIDGDILCYQAASAHEYETQWSFDLWTLHGHLEPAIIQLDTLVASIREGIGADRVVITLSSGLPNWRLSVLPTYKSNRKGKRKPVTYRPLRQYVEETYDTISYPHLEGDDVLGILATATDMPGLGERVIVSLDKDLKGIPGLLLNDGKAREAIALNPYMTYADCVAAVGPEEADRWHLLQALAGDPTDGFSGCPGFGLVTAEKLLDGGCVLESHEHTLSRGPRKGQVETRWEAGAAGSPWEIIVSAYKSAGLGEEVALQMARVSRILRAEEYDREKEEVILWQPAQ